MSDEHEELMDRVRAARERDDDELLDRFTDHELAREWDFSMPVSVPFFGASIQERVKVEREDMVGMANAVVMRVWEGWPLDLDVPIGLKGART